MRASAFFWGITAVTATFWGARAGAASPRGPEPCVPECRSGFVCVRDRCVSACNPSCPDDQSCTAEGECISRTASDDAGARRHDGFYVHLGLGAGYFNVSQEESAAVYALERLEGSITGLAQLGEILVGGTVGRGIVLGGGAWGANAFAPTYDGDGIDVPSGRPSGGTEDLELSSLSIIGPFVAWYFDPADGLYASLGLGFAVVATGGMRQFSERHAVSSSDSTGFGAVTSLGYEWWIGSQWSLGLAARLQLATSSQEKGADHTTHTTVIPGLLGTVTYH